MMGWQFQSCGWENRMIQRRNLPLCTACCFLFLIPGLSAQTLQIIDAEGRSSTLTAAQITGSPHVTVSVEDHDVSARFEGVAVATLLSRAGIQLGDKLRGPRMTDVLLVEAADGYKVVFALAEVDPAFATREIILADKRDGKPLDTKEGPLRIVSPGDRRAARWVRQVTVLRIIAVK
jgi:hypothetical protein